MSPMHHFMRADLLTSLAAIGLFPILLFVPGYVIGWGANLFEFRHRTPAFRIALSLPLSASTCPILIYLIGRFLSLTAAEAVLGAFTLCFILVMFRHGLGWPHVPRAARFIVLGWLLVCLFTSVDMQIGGRDYYPVTAFDYSVRSEFIHSIGNTGIAPGNPFFFPGHSVPLRYHYFWLLLPGLVHHVTGHAIGPRSAWIGSVFWAGLAFMSLIAVTFRVFWHGSVASFPRRATAGILLLGVTGLDIIPTAVLWLLRASGMVHAVLPSIEWWNEQVDGFVYTALWEAHHLGGLVACMMAFLLLEDGAQQATFARRALYGGIAGLVLASAVGSSIYIAFVFAIYLLLWTLIVLTKRWWRTAVVLSIAGSAGIVLGLPYLLSLTSPGSQGPAASGGPSLQLWMRPFFPTHALFSGLGATRPMLDALDGLMLPLNYFFELGFFFVAATLWWRKRRAAQKPLSQRELALAVLVTTSIVICTFLRSSVISNNDLGWRGFLLAQFGLLLWSVDVLSIPSRKRLLTVLLVLGAVGTAYDVAILRVYPVLADLGVVANSRWMAPDRHLGERNYAAREAYEWIAKSTPSDAVVQFDPHVALQDTSALLYADRQIAAADLECLSVFGGDPSLCPALIAKLAHLYPDQGQPAVTRVGDACQNLPVDILVAKETDTVWADPQSWVWKESPMFANPKFRVFRCRGSAK
jgi:hypothetical protein